MDKSVIASMIDHAVLRPEATDADLERECKLAVSYGVATVCVKPSHVSLAYQFLKDTKVVVSTVVGFPHGATTTACKVAEAVEALQNGAKELDMVINIGKLLSGDLDYVKNDIAKVVEATHEKGGLLKVIIETSLLEDDKKILACRLSSEAGADYVKTSTGFNGGGAILEDILLMKASIASNVKVKASGGIKTLEHAMAFIKEGCSRLGTSATKEILEGTKELGTSGGY